MAKNTKFLTGFDALLTNFVFIEQIMKKKMAVALKSSTDMFLNRMRDNVSLTDHSLKDLRDLDHPYSKRAPVAIHDPDWLVHAQTWQLWTAIDSVEIPLNANDTSVDIGIDETIAPYASDVIFGTSTMVARDFVTGTFEELKDDALDIFEKAHLDGLSRFL